MAYLGDGIYSLMDVIKASANPQINYEGLYQDTPSNIATSNLLKAMGPGYEYRNKSFIDNAMATGGYDLSGNVPVDFDRRRDFRNYFNNNPLRPTDGVARFTDFNPRVGTILPFQPYENPTFLAKQNVNPYLGIMSQAPDSLGFDTSFGVANEPDDEDDINKIKETRTGIAKLFEFLQKLPTPMNLLRGGLESLSGFNQRLRNTDFGQSRTGAEYAMRRRERKQAERAQEAMPEVYRSAREQNFTNQRGGFSTSRADRGGTSAGSGQFSSRRSTGRQGY